MATKGTLLNLIDVMKRRDPDGSIAKIVEIMNETNQISEDVYFVEGNKLDGNTVTIRTGLPTVGWRRLNYGIAQSKSKTQQVTDATGLLEAHAEIDEANADMNGDGKEVRATEAVSFIEAMMQEFVGTLFYGDVTQDSDQFTGLAPRFSTISTDKKQSGYNIIDAGGVGSDNTSVWLITWSDKCAHGIFPKGSMTGLRHIDNGRQRTTDPDGNPFYVYADQFTWHVGLTVKDWRGIARVANIDVSLLIAGSVALDDFMIDAYYRAKKLGGKTGKRVWYCTDTVLTALHKIAKDKVNVNLMIRNFEGEEILTFMGIPIKECEQILETETQVV